MNKTFKKFVLPVLFVIFCVLFVLQISVSANTEYSAKIDSVTLDKEATRVSIKATLDASFAEAHKGESVYFFRLSANNNASDLSSLTPFAEKKAAVSLSQSTAFEKHHIYSSYVIAQKNEDGTYSAISDNVYIKNPEILTQNDESFPIRTTKKGLITLISTDAQYLGAAHTTVDVEIDDYICATKGDNTITYTFFGQSFYINEAKLQSLDRKIKAYSDAGMTVYLNILLGKCEDDALSFLYFAGESPSALYSLNTQDLKPARHYAAFCEFIANRYSNADGKYGFVPGYILGYEVNAVSKWGYLHSSDTVEYIKNYERAYRILYNAVKSTYSNGRVYISLSNLFNSDGTGDIGAREFIDSFASEIKNGSDIAWSLAINPYASDPANTEFWNDPKATSLPDTQYVTMKNLDVLTDYMKDAKLTYNGNVRDIIISSFGISGNYNNTDNAERQAAAYALAYIIAEANEHIDAFIYYRQIDHPQELQKFGLWSTSSLSSPTPDYKKPIYGIFRDVDSDNYAKGIEMAKSYVTTELYNKYIKDYSHSVKRKTIESLPIQKSDIPSKYTETALFDLTDGDLFGFYSYDSQAYTELRPIDSAASYTALYTVLKPISKDTYMGVAKKFEDTEKLSSDYLTLTFKPVTPNTQTLTVLLRLDCEKDGIKYVYEGLTQLPSNERASLSYDISEFVEKTGGEINSLRLWYKPSNGEIVNGEYGLWLENVSIHDPIGMGSFLEILAAVLPILLIAALIVGIVYIYKNKRILNKLKEIFGKTKSRILNFLRNKKIISAKYKKKKKKSPAPNPQKSSDNKGTRVKDVPTIINGRVITPPARRSMQNESYSKPNLQNGSKVRNTVKKGEDGEKQD